MRVALVTPVYMSQPKEEELLSIDNTIDVFGSSLDKYFIAPVGLDMKAYAKFVERGYSVKFLKRRYFKSPQTYNRLMRSLVFFDAFSEYDYILIVHSDAWVFRDDLAYWTKKGFDYVGAPLYEFNNTMEGGKYIGVGNGGFSMHNVKSAVSVLNSWKIVYSLNDLMSWYMNYNLKGKIVYLFYFLRMLIGFGRYAHSRFNDVKINEDVWWGTYVPKTFDWYRVAPFDDAYKFSMEYNGEYLLRLNGNVLPFGCHGWFSEQLKSFWMPRILNKGNEIQE